MLRLFWCSPIIVAAGCAVKEANSPYRPDGLVACASGIRSRRCPASAATTCRRLRSVLSSNAVLGAGLIRSNDGVDLTAVLPNNDDCAIANGKSGTEQFGHFVGKRRGEGNRAPGDSPTLTGRASARYDLAVGELIPLRAGLGAKGAPSVALLKETRSSRYRKIDTTLGSLPPKGVGGVVHASYRICIGWAHNDALQQALSPCDGDCLWRAPSFSTRK